MGFYRLKWRQVYFVMSLLLPLCIVYPAMIYLDLAGMGGYDGFASPNMMLEHGTWRALNKVTLVHRIMNGIYLLWLFSLLNLLILIGYCLISRRGS